MIHKSTKRNKERKIQRNTDLKYEILKTLEREKKKVCIIPVVTAAWKKRSNANGYKKPGEELGETSYLQNCFELIQKVCLMESVRIIKKNAWSGHVEVEIVNKIKKCGVILMFHKLSL